MRRVTSLDVNLPNLEDLTVTDAESICVLSLWTPKLKDLHVGNMETLRTIIPSQPFTAQLKSFVLGKYK